MPSTKRRRSRLESLHLFLVRLFGLGLVGAFAYGAATRDMPQGLLAVFGVLCFVSLAILLSGRFRPVAVTRPHRWYHVLTFPLWFFLAQGLALAIYGEDFSNIPPSVLQTAATSASAERLSILQAALPADTALIITIIGFACWLPLLTMLGLLFQKPRGPVGRPQAAPKIDLRDYQPRPRTKSLHVFEQIAIRLTAFATLPPLVQLLAWAWTDDRKFETFLPLDDRSKIAVALLTVFLAAITFMPRLPRGSAIWRPGSPMALVRKMISLGIIVASLYQLLPLYWTIVNHPRVFELFAIRLELSVGIFALLALVAFALYDRRDGSMIAPEEDRPMQEITPENDPARATPVEERKPVPLATVNKLPSIGGAMKLYIATDWLVLRLLGLALLGVAWMLWDMIAAERTAQATEVAFGYDPSQAMWAYAALGAILTLPFLMPRALAMPRHVFFGMVKAVLLVAIAFALLTPLEIAIEQFTPKIYHATLLATVPKLFKPITGVAVTSVLLISFFKQLQKVPATDYRGEAKVEFSTEELRALRKARMGILPTN